MSSAALLRGSVWFADLNVGEKPVVIVSNNRRNGALDTVLGVRITTALKPDIASIVAIPEGESLVGRVLCDDILVLSKPRFKRHVGGLSPRAMRMVDVGLKSALAIR